MKTALIFVLSLLFALSTTAQGKRFTEEHKIEQLLEMQDGILLVPLFRAASTGGIMTTNGASEPKIRAEHNSQIIRAFETDYPFGRVLYFYGEDWLKILQGEHEGLILDAEKNPVSSEIWEDKTFFLARFEPSGWHLPSDIEYKKKSVGELQKGEEAFREELPKVIGEKTALAIPLYRNYSETQNVHHNLLNERLKEKNKTIVSELNACQRSYPVYFFYENLWAQIKEKLRMHFLTAAFHRVREK